MNQRVENEVITNARIMFRNFKGEKSRYNKEGDKNFCVVIDDMDHAKELIDIGWNVKILKPREEGDEPLYYIPVAIRYDIIPPKIYMVTKTKKILLDEDTVKTLDYAEIVNVDLELRPYCWTGDNGETGIKAYCHKMYVDIYQSPLDLKYENLGEE